MLEEESWQSPGNSVAVPSEASLGFVTTPASLQMGSASSLMLTVSVTVEAHL